MVYSEINKNAALQRQHTKELLDQIGSTITLIPVTETKNAMGRVLTYTEGTSSTFKGDIQFLTEEDLKHLDEGEIAVGQAKLYAEYSVSLNAGDKIEFDSQRWKLVKKINSPATGSSRDYQEWLLQRINEA